MKQYGWSGLAIYKAATTLVVVASVLIILRHKPRLAAAVATMACLLVLAVALYSHNLLTG